MRGVGSAFLLVFAGIGVGGLLAGKAPLFLHQPRECNLCPAAEPRSDSASRGERPQVSPVLEESHPKG